MKNGYSYVWTGNNKQRKKIDLYRWVNKIPARIEQSQSHTRKI